MMLVFGVKFCKRAEDESFHHIQLFPITFRRLERHRRALTRTLQHTDKSPPSNCQLTSFITTSLIFSRPRSTSSTTPLRPDKLKMCYFLWRQRWKFSIRMVKMGWNQRHFIVRAHQTEQTTAVAAPANDYYRERFNGFEWSEIIRKKIVDFSHSSHRSIANHHEHSTDLSTSIFGRRWC